MSSCTIFILYKLIITVLNPIRVRGNKYQHVEDVVFLFYGS